MLKPEPVLDSETHKIFWDFKIQTNGIIQNRIPDLVLFKKKERTCQLVDLTVRVNHKVKLKESEKRDSYNNYNNNENWWYTTKWN